LVEPVACIILGWVNTLSNPQAHVRAGRLVSLGALAGSWSRCHLRRRLDACRLHRIWPRVIVRLAGDRSRISGLPAVVARVLGAMVSTAFARSSVAPAVLRRAVIG
jgi:hypothetical protein